jgi:hypothetical protein
MSDDVITAVVLGAIAIILCLSYLRGRPQRQSAGAEKRLLLLCHGDKAQMERLISLELQRNPDIPRAEAAARAIHSRRRDNQ